MVEDARMLTRDGGESDEAGSTRSRRRFLTQAIGGAGVLALAATGAVALRRADAKDEDDDDADERDEDRSGHGGDDHDDADDDIRRVGTPVAGAIEVVIDDDDADGFSPRTLTVDLGASVTFVNLDDDPHTATSTAFDTGVIEPGGVVTVRLDEPGTVFYACVIHPVMTGTIVVRDADGALPDATPGATPRVIAVADSTAGETVAIRDFAFAPPSVTVPVGTTVTWENGDTAPHTASAEDGGFDTGRIDAGGNGSASFDQPGTFAYRCEFHPDMRGTIIVE